MKNPIIGRMARTGQLGEGTHYYTDPRESQERLMASTSSETASPELKATAAAIRRIMGAHNNQLEGEAEAQWRVRQRRLPKWDGAGASASLSRWRIGG